MMKKCLVLSGALAMILSAGSICHASIIAPYGPGQIGLSAVVLCESLSLRQESTADAEAVKTLHFGDRIIVMSQKDGWAECCLSDAVDAGPEGWAKSEYIAIDPAWYKTDAVTSVFAWNDTGAKKVAELDKDVTLPILKDDGDWLVVSLRGASGWIYKNDADYTVSEQSSNTSTGKNQNTSDQGSGTKGDTTSGQTGWTGADFGEGAGLEDNWADYGENSNNENRTATSGDGEGAGFEDNWADYYDGKFDNVNGNAGTGDGEGAGFEDNWADYNENANAYTGDGEGAGFEDNWADY